MVEEDKGQARPFVKDTRALLTIIDLSSILPGWAILTKRPTSFWVAGEMKIVDNKQTSLRDVQGNTTLIVEE